eukprot:TRINITY_DN48184_c0_g1_i1.p1 TRINITY_DN48184_c0_g1~~TRINITY_DN48184_c0_g1_i1.p1  ORF type:complete len:472 (-),score=45.95 TRINITY_DN48184_c0_g1_i1:68-1483(-)
MAASSQGAPPRNRRVLVVGAQFSGLAVARGLKDRFYVTVVDAKEYFEYTPGILRAYVKPAHINALTFTLQPVVERELGVKFLWGEVTALDADAKTASIKVPHATEPELVYFDFCIIASGCNFGPFRSTGESLWFPVIHEHARRVSKWAHLDERFLEGRRRHILEEFERLSQINEKEGDVLVVGAGFIGVEWAAELEHFFPNMNIVIMDQMPRCLGPLPLSAAEYCSEYLSEVGVSQYYSVKYAPKSEDFWSEVGLPDGADESYVTIGWKASNYFLPKKVLSENGPGGGGWIMFNKNLQVMRRCDSACDGQRLGVWADGSVFAVGDCNLGCVGEPPNFEIPPIPKIAYPAEAQACHAVRNVKILDVQRYGHNGGITAICCPLPRQMRETWWPWGAGAYSISLGPNDGCFIVGATHAKDSGSVVSWWRAAAVQKTLLETTKVDASRGRFVGATIWYLVHNFPLNLWGGGPLFA